jgi:hypothetical protein
MEAMQWRIWICCFLVWFLPAILSAEDILIDRYIGIDCDNDSMDIDIEFKKKNIFHNNCLFGFTAADGIFTSLIDSELIFSQDYMPDTNTWVECTVNLDEFINGLLIKTKVNILTNEGRENEIVAIVRGPALFEITPFFNYNYNRWGLNGTYYCFGARKNFLLDTDTTIKMEGTITESYVALEKNECADLYFNMNFFLFEKKIKTKIFLEKNWGEEIDEPEKIGVQISLIL